MSRYESLFRQCDQQKRIAFIPFVMLGDPDFDTSIDIIKTLVEAGADALELGIPFSDPVADGPVIQTAAIRALSSNMTTTRSFEILARVRELFPDIPIGLLLYSNLVYRKGIEAFYKQCATDQIDSVLIADVPLRESTLFDGIANKHGVESVHILPPNPGEKTLQQVAKLSKGYTYVLGRAGVTGAGIAAKMPSQDIMQKLTQYNAAPPVMGFGISKPEQVTEAKAHGFKGAISGSAVVNIIENNLSNKTKMLSELALFVERMKAAT
ncbi:tryptophan synthase subunit alpha [Pleionea mediterranea]|jgi:tryptophan synthase alpha chain|uniref:Tryptophan synthase alpha chain n=1 Tax=Pleionea mediterranea TaxID=523701 RepID=A0A316FMY4_9GAMM|nr:tryptophan synthase subunit alpha [Pleionea mediterranea]PWK50104.1 tryptophan synthase alpha chain [Pleionea mediterranea]